MKRILMLNYEFPPLGGGAGNATYYLLKEFSKIDDLQIDLVTSSVNRYKKEQFSSNIKIHYLNIGKKGNLHYQSKKDLLEYSWKAYFFSKRLIKNQRYDFIHAFFGIPCGYIAMKLSLPYIVSLRGSDVPGHNPKFNKIYFLLSPLLKKIWEKARFIVANSEDLKNTALKFYSEARIDVIPNGVDWDGFRPNPARRRNNIFRVLYVGRFHKIKGINYLIDAFKQFAQERNDVELVLVGEGPLYAGVKKENSSFKKIRILGRKEQSELIKIYQRSDVFVLPSLNEGMSNTLLEAMACGLAVIATNTGGAKELLGRDGIIMKKENSQEIFQGLEKLYSNRELLRNMKIQSRQKAKKMSWEEGARKYLDIYDICAE